MQCCYAQSNISVTSIYMFPNWCLPVFLRLKTQRIKDETTVTCQTHQFLSNNAEKPND